MSKFWHVLTSVVLAAIAVVSPAVQSTVTHHPTVALVLASIWGILGNLLPSPVAKQ